MHETVRPKKTFAKVYGRSIQKSVQPVPNCGNENIAGTAIENDLFDALSHAEFKERYSLDQVRADFKEGRKGVVSFNYGGTREMFCYVPVKGTDWFLTYLIRENVISDRISSVTSTIFSAA